MSLRVISIVSLTSGTVIDYKDDGCGIDGTPHPQRAHIAHILSQKEARIDGEIVPLFRLVKPAPRCDVRGDSPDKQRTYAAHDDRFDRQYLDKSVATPAWLALGAKFKDAAIEREQRAAAESASKLGSAVDKALAEIASRVNAGADKDDAPITRKAKA